MKEFFGTYKESEIYLFTLENEGFVAKVTNYGATLVSLIEKETGIDVVQGYDTLEEYMQQDFYTGASVGRTANRIGKGTFSLNGKTYHLPINNNGNCNHGGIEGFNRKAFAYKEEDNSVIFSYLSVDGEEGYPGNLKVNITYTLCEDGLLITAEGTSDQDTLFAYTNHAYFNLDASDNALNHEVKIYADQYGLSDANGMTQDRLENVEGTPFDFRQFKTPAQDIEAENEQLTFGNGYDHFFLIKGEGMRDMAVCLGQKLQLTVSSDLPGMHLYSSNYLDGIQGKKGVSYPKRSALCFEAEYMPNAINYTDIKEKPIVKANETLTCHIKYALKRR